MSVDNLLSVSDLCVKIDGKEILKKISFEIKSNQILGIVGESGSGKSVTSLAIMGLLSEKSEISGKIFFQEKDLISCTEQQKRIFRGSQISMVFQEPMTSLNPSIRCGEQVAEVIKNHSKKTNKEVKNEVFSLFEKVKLPDIQRIYKSYPHQLSGGQKQRIMIAMAIACKPLLLIADEPTTALDASVQKEVIDLIKEIQRETKMSVLFISHDISLVSQIADNVIVMRKGEVVEKGEVQQIFTNPKQVYTKALLASKPDKKIRYKRLFTINDFLKKDVNKEIISLEQREKKHQEIYKKEPLLVVSKLVKEYEVSKIWYKKIKNKVIDEVSFSVYEGETLGLVGESGCGKTTLGRILVRLETANSGAIFYKGKNYNDLILKGLAKKSREIQIIFQDPYSSLNPSIKIGEAILEPMKIHQLYQNDEQRKEKVIEILRQVGLQEQDFYKYPHQFSGGQRQRIGIARAIALNPKIIICDESVSALDISVQAQVLNLLNDLKEKYKFTYLFISHDLQVVKYMSDRVMVMKQGKIIEFQEADKLYECPKNPYTKKLLSLGY